MVKRILLLGFILFFAFLGTFFAVAADGLSPYLSDEIEYEAEYKGFLDGIPQDIVGALPEGVFSEESGERLLASEELSRPEYVFGIIFDVLGVHINDAVHMLARIVGVLLLGALADSALKNFGVESFCEAFSFCQIALLLIMIVKEQMGMIRAVELFLSRLVSLINSMIPLMGVLYASAGNVTSAAVSSSSLAFFIAVCENLLFATLMPAVGISLAFSVVSALSGKGGLGKISSFFGKIYTWGLSLLMSIFALVMSTQNSLAAKADSLGARAAKFAAGTFIPIAGGAVGESLRTVGAGVDYIKASVGTLGIVIIMLLVLPVIISLILARASLGISSVIAGMLGCQREEKLLSEIGTAYGYMLAVSALCSVFFIYAITLFVRCNSALLF